MSEPLILGAVAYDDKVVSIWEGFKSYFFRRGLEFPLAPLGTAVRGRTS